MSYAEVFSLPVLRMISYLTFFSLSSDDCPTSNGTEAKQMETNGNGESIIADSSSLSSNQTQSNEYQNTNPRLISNIKVGNNLLDFYILQVKINYKFD